MLPAAPFRRPAAASPRTPARPFDDVRWRGRRLLARWAGVAAIALAACAAAVAQQRSPTHAAAAPAPAANTSLFLEDLTTEELRGRIAAGATTVLVPIGGTEQNGPHIALGKHNARARALAALIAARLGDAIIAPVMAYVPEGSIDPPAGHMRYPGTISISDAAFEALLEGAVRSLARHGFKHVVLLGDHGGYQRILDRVAQRLSRSNHGVAPTRVYALNEYYRAARADYSTALKARGHSADEIGTHAGLADTALMLALEPAMVRQDRLGSAATKPNALAGVDGDPRGATAALGSLGVQQIVDTSVSAIRERTQARPSPSPAQKD